MDSCYWFDAVLSGVNIYGLKEELKDKYLGVISSLIEYELWYNYWWYYYIVVWRI